MGRLDDLSLIFYWNSQRPDFHLAGYPFHQLYYTGFYGRTQLNKPIRQEVLSVMGYLNT